MGSGEQRINRLGDMGFNGAVGKNVAVYAKETQRLGRDMASELDNAATDARQAMLKLRKHPLLRGLDVRLRSRLVARRLKRARDCAKGISAEAVKFNLEYRKQFLGVDDSRAKYRGEVDL